MRNIILITVFFFSFNVSTSCVYDYDAGKVCNHVIFENDLTEVDIITSIVYAESAGEYSNNAQNAILDVISNRISSKHYPNSPLGVVLQRGQFDGKWQHGYKYRNTKRYTQIKNIVVEWYAGCYPITVLDFGYCWYYNPKTSTDKKFVAWAQTRPSVIIGNHRFFK